MLFLLSDFFQNQLFRKILSQISFGCGTDWIQIRPDIMSGLIWVQTVCKNYQQATLGDKRVKVLKNLDLDKCLEQFLVKEFVLRTATGKLKLP